MAKKETQKNQLSSAVDIQYVNNGNLEDISWARIVNAQPNTSDEYGEALIKNRPVPAMLAVDCENVSKAHIPLAVTRVTDDSVELEMTVTSEFTLIGYQDQDDELIPDEETLQNYVQSSDFPLGDGRKTAPVSTRNGRIIGSLEVPRVKQEKPDSPSPASRRGRRRRVITVNLDEYESDTEACDTEASPYIKSSEVKSSRVAKIRKYGIKTECMYKCEDCDRSFPTAGGLKNHQVVHSEGGSYVCFLCGSAFKTPTNLKAHISTHPAAEVENACEECGHWFKDRTLLTKHIGRHAAAALDDGRKIVDCGMCGEEYETDADLAEHVLGHVSELKQNMCLVCGRHLAPLSSMEKHLRTHTGAKMATCPICSHQFTEAYNLKSHMRIHTGEKPYACPQCKRRFTSVSTLKNHILTHSGEKNYPCTYCDKRFRRSSHMVEHRRSHTGERPYPCVYCGNRYTTSTAMRSHMITHTREKRFSCPLCEFATPRTLSLRKHMKMHEDRPDAEGEVSRQYMCADCGRQFSRMKNMEKHIAMHKRRQELGMDDVAVESRTHMMDKIYGCTKCDRKFARYRNLQKHAVVHGDADVEIAGKPFRRIGDKPYICAECGRPFARIGNMQKHFMTHWDQEMEDDKSELGM